MGVEKWEKLYNSEGKEKTKRYSFPKWDYYTDTVPKVIEKNGLGRPYCFKIEKFITDDELNKYEVNTAISNVLEETNVSIPKMPF